MEVDFLVTVLMIDAIDVTWWQPQEIQQQQDNA